MPDEKDAPPQVQVQSLNDYLEVMSKAVFQSGMSWQVVNAKWPDTNEAFHGFEIGRVAGLTEEELEELAQDKRVIRNRRKLAAIAHNAQRIIELDAEHGCFIDYLRSHGDFYERRQRPQKAIQIPRRHRLLLLSLRNRRTSPTARRMDVRQRARQTAVISPLYLDGRGLG